MAGMRVADNLKAIRLDDLPPEAWTYLTGGDDSASNVLDFYEHVPWLRRGVDLRMDAVKRLPYKIQRIGGADDEWVSLDDFDLTAALGYQMKLREVLGQWAGHLTLFGAAYGHKLINLGGRSRGFRVLHPTTMCPITTAEDGLTGFKRALGGESITLTLEDVVYVWMPSMRYELAPGSAPATAALHAAGILSAMQLLGKLRFEKGALKPMLMLVPDGTSEADRDRLQSWAKRMISGVKNSFGITAVREGVSFQELGSNIGDLAMPDLTTLQREDIATALGVPQTLLFSNAANYATSENDYRQFYDTTVIPAAERMCDALNEQLFGQMGLKLAEAHEQLEMYQDDKEAESYRLIAGVEAGLILPDEFRARMEMGEFDEKGRAEALEWLRLVTLAKNPVISAPQAPIVVEAEPGTAEQAAQEAQARQERNAATADVESESKSAPATAVVTVEDELDKWQRKAVRRFEEGKPEKALEFESDVIPPVLAAAIRGALEAAQDAAGVRSAFVWGLYP